MANLSRGGFRWVKNESAPTSTTPPIVYMKVADDYGTALNIGDPVKRVSDGTIAACSAGDRIFGIYDGAAQYYDGSVIRSGPTLPASTSYDTNLERMSIARVIPAQGQIFELDADDGTTATTQAAHEAFVNENCEWVAGTAVNGQSGAALDISTHATTNTLSLNIVEIPSKSLQDFAASRVKYWVKVNLLDVAGAGVILGV